MYRIMAGTPDMLQAGIDLNDPDAIGAASVDVALSVGDDPNVDHYSLAGEDVSSQIRGDEVTRGFGGFSGPASRCQRLGGFAARVGRRRRERGGGRAATSGRSCCPTPMWKLSSTASAEYAHVGATTRISPNGLGDDYETVLADVRRRDHLDSTRAMSLRADDVIVVDTQRDE